MNSNPKTDSGTDSENTAIRIGPWIRSALEYGHGRKLIVAHDYRIPGFFAILDMPDFGSRIGEAGSTPGEALAGLDKALCDDASLNLKSPMAI